METIDKLKQLTAWDVAPELAEEELEECLAGVALEDLNGFAPINEEWTPTYDLNAAAAQAWLIKAARAAATVDEPTAGVVSRPAAQRRAVHQGRDAAFGRDTCQRRGRLGGGILDHEIEQRAEYVGREIQYRRRSFDGDDLRRTGSGSTDLQARKAFRRRR